MQQNKMYVDSSCHGRKASGWSDPHQAPPFYPLKFGTPHKYSISGDTGWNPT